MISKEKQVEYINLNINNLHYKDKLYVGKLLYEKIDEDLIRETNSGIAIQYNLITPMLLYEIYKFIKFRVDVNKELIKLI